MTKHGEVRNMRYLAFLPLFFLVGCGKYQVGPEFQPYVDKFIQADPQHRPITNLVIEFGKTASDEAAATCYPNDGIAPRIAVSQEWWQIFGSDVTMTELLLFHELGHCILGRKHLNQTKDNFPVSIMYPSPDDLALQAEYSSDPKPLLKELFNYSADEP